MIHVEFDPQRLPLALKTEWEQLQSDVDKAIKENIVAWETWKQLKRYEELLKKTRRIQPEDAELESLRQVLKLYIQPTGEVDPVYRSSKPSFNFEKRQKIWAGIKRFLLENVFHYKCAYCETQTGQFHYDAEHYRPKGEVTVASADDVRRQHVVTEDERGERFEHPGYFWLAFEWKNLVPSCKSCNGPGGKMTHFPVQQSHILLKHLTPEEAAAFEPPPYPSPTWPDMYYLRTEQLDQLEDPLLLHPYMDKANDPRRHIRFKHKGIEYAFEGSSKGEHSIKVFRLYKESLRTARYKAQTRAANLFLAAYQHYLLLEQMSPEESWEKARSKLCEFEEGKEQFCAAALDFVEETWMQFRLAANN